MTQFGYFIMMDFVRHQFHIYFGNMNDPTSWKWTGSSFANMIEAEDKIAELDEAGDDHELTTPHQ